MCELLGGCVVCACWHVYVNWGCVLVCMYSGRYVLVCVGMVGCVCELGVCVLACVCVGL